MFSCNLLKKPVVDTDRLLFVIDCNCYKLRTPADLLCTDQNTIIMLSTAFNSPQRDPLQNNVPQEIRYHLSVVQQFVKRGSS